MIIIMKFIFIILRLHCILEEDGAGSTVTNYMIDYLQLLSVRSNLAKKPVDIVFKL
jgi:hypothetical protein